MSSPLILEYLSLAALSLLAATIIPVSSEAALAGLLALGGQPGMVLLFATVGNCAGVALNYWLGLKAGEAFLEKQLKKPAVARAYIITQRWGKWALLLSWLPVVGDPVTILAGVCRIQFRFFVLVAFPLRFLRYLVIAGVFDMIAKS